MKSKFLLPLAMFVLVGIPVLAQTSDAEAEAIINLLGVQRREAIRQLVPMAKKDSAAFWKIYGEYEATNRKTAKFRLQLYEKTARSYGEMTPQVADSLALKYFANRVDQEKMLQDYYKRIKAATTPVVAFEFYQAEIYMLTQLRAQIMAQIPTYGQLMNSIPKN
ncbi:MAG TPA: hypothetical protein VG737_14485 [Cyclobacteriaceae bacterium]|nr:hypothetical protein [Cyclobacteriaceae bacterium]